jgi:selenocysteine-specific elongation factor
MIRRPEPPTRGIPFLDSIMKRLILGTAGHIDHGKTALVKALTGIDTDRLKEEKERGITIELGFAHLTLPSGQRLGIVDVPGHEKFIRHMVAGAGGVDLVALIVAADESIMPQTREHMQILSLLGVGAGLVVLTKTDMVEQDMVDLVTEEVRDFTRGTFLEGCPIVAVSSVTGRGIDALIKTLDEMAASLEGTRRSGIFRLPIDRVFTMKGFGTVVTGTLMSGGVRVGEDVAIMPRGSTARVRGIQVHGAPESEATAGTRTAVNLSGVETDGVSRGDVLVSPGSIEPSYMIDARFCYLSENQRNLKNREQVKIYFGTSEIIGNVVILDADEIAPGRETFVQFRLTEPAVTLPGDRFIVRLLSPAVTIGGGEVLNAVARKHKRFREEVIHDVSTLALGKEEERAIVFIKDAGYAGVTAGQLSLRMGLAEGTAGPILKRLGADGAAITFDSQQGRWIEAAAYGRLVGLVQERVGEYHKKNPTEPGINKEELLGKLPWGVDARLLGKLLADLSSGRVVAVSGDRVALFGRDVRLAEGDEHLVGKAVEAVAQGQLTPPTTAELAESLSAKEADVKKLLSVAARDGRIVRVKDNLYFDREIIAGLKQRLVSHLKETGEITTQQFKDLTGASRKYTIPLLEYFDSERVTIRVGEVRKLRERQA